MATMAGFIFLGPQEGKGSLGRPEGRLENYDVIACRLSHHPARGAQSLASKMDGDCRTPRHGVIRMQASEVGDRRSEPVRAESVRRERRTSIDKEDQVIPLIASRKHSRSARKRDYLAETELALPLPSTITSPGFPVCCPRPAALLTR